MTQKEIMWLGMQPQPECAMKKKTPKVTSQILLIANDQTATETSTLEYSRAVVESHQKQKEQHQEYHSNP